ncbi:zinc ribbon domain-containing protein [Candidatus Desantisbacteria bacterium CG1_02_38_46]|uniref:Zinc ribbon domain-containing protein n=2 Tax=unclassified Candidatus Desantisiibacteriota TaxID=3106372 RepID=A0A1J4S9D3_9BACT|nr:MAG: zinc ribbon domain-containing protein [Candidatus Desantisbacteria bacterium CG1_02_38_46]
MALQPFTRNFADNSTEAGFQFTFFCDICNDGYKTKFIESRTYKKKSFLSGLGKAVSLGATILGKSNIGYQISRGSDILSERFQGMTPEWHKEHESAFEFAQNEAKEHFRRCPKCTKYVCENDWNEQATLCIGCAPRESVEVASARAEKMVEDIKAKAAGTTVFTGEVDRRQTICPECGKPAGEGKFCNNCGATLGLIKCPKCGAQSPAETKFCGECGTKFE